MFWAACVRRLVWPAIVAGLGAVALIAASAAPASVASSGGWTVQESRDPGGPSHKNLLNGVAATSSANAWAVGEYWNGRLRTLIERWNDKAWKVQKSPNPGGSSYSPYLFGVAATSRSDAWAVGDYFKTNLPKPPGPFPTLIEHWNGKVWKVQKSPNPGGSSGANALAGVAATSHSDAWAVGDYSNKTGPNRTLIEHWNGKAWKLQKSPNRGGSGNDNGLSGVAAVSSKDAWAVGAYDNNGEARTLIEHWNGTAWRVQASPNPGGSSHNNNVLKGVAATSPNSAWAVGSDANGAFVEHWNGKAWSVVLNPSPGGSAAGVSLDAVTATSSTNAWAVGYYYSGTARSRRSVTLVEHWNGKAWKVQESPTAGSTDNYLNGVAAVSRSNAWAVGDYGNRFTYQTLVEHRG